MRRCVGILINKEITSAQFVSDYVPIINEEMLNPNVCFLVPFRPILVWRYLVSSKFRAVQVYVSHDETDVDMSLNPIKKMKYEIIYKDTEEAVWDIISRSNRVIN